MDTNGTGETIGSGHCHADRTGGADLRAAGLNRRDAADAEQHIRNQIETDNG